MSKRFDAFQVLKWFLLLLPKRFDAFQVLKWFLLLLEVTCVIFARATNTNVWQAIVARADRVGK